MLELSMNIILEVFRCYTLCLLNIFSVVLALILHLFFLVVTRALIHRCCSPAGSYRFGFYKIPILHADFGIVCMSITEITIYRFSAVVLCVSSISTSGTYMRHVIFFQ